MDLVQTKNLSVWMKNGLTQHVQSVSADERVSRACYEECQSWSAVSKYMMVWKGGLFKDCSQFLTRTENGDYPEEMIFESFSE